MSTTSKLTQIARKKLLATNVKYSITLFHEEAHRLRDSKAQFARRWQSTGAEPPPAGGHLPSVATSVLLRQTRDSALRAPGIAWVDEGSAPTPNNVLPGRETRKMNLYQAVRDAMRYAWHCL